MTPATLRDAGLVALVKALASAAILASGFRALSDDDYARIVIAQRFAHAPHFDPSGTSWLPLPFWVNGATMLAFGSSVETARTTAFVLGIWSMLLVFVAARWLGLARRAALLGTLIACVFPYSAWLGVAAVPELPAAALVLLGLASLSQAGSRRALGALAITAACLSRYEAWPVAGFFALHSGWEAMTRTPSSGSKVPNRSWLWAATGIAVAGPTLWLLNGYFAHDDALFFVQRVSEYRRAIGAGVSDPLRALLRHPALLLRSEPELVAFASAATVLSLVVARPELARHRRIALGLAALVAFLVVGDLRDGAATHHAERTLLAVWLWLALIGADAFDRTWSHTRGGARAATLASLGLLVAPMAGVVRPWYAARDSFIDRSAEVAMGKAARDVATEGQRLLIDTPDFAFYAVMAGFGDPTRAAPLDDHDPRKPRPPDPYASAATLERVVVRENAHVMVIPLARRAAASELGEITQERGGLALIRLRR